MGRRVVAERYRVKDNVASRGHRCLGAAYLFVSAREYFRNNKKEGKIKAIYNNWEKYFDRDDRLISNF